MPGSIAILVCVLWTVAGARVATAQSTADAGTPAAEGEDQVDPHAGIEEYEVRGLRVGGNEGSPSALGSHVETDVYVAEHKRLEDMLAAQVGVHVRRFGGPGERATISIRGSAPNQVALLLDGVPMNSALTGSADVSVQCTDLIEGIGIARSGAAPVAGGGAIGGVVEFESRRPDGRAVNRARVSGGAFGTIEGSLLRAASAGPLEYTLGYCGFRTDGDYEFARPVTEVLTAEPFDPPVIERINNERVRHSGTLGLGGALGRFGHLEFSDYLTYTSHGEPGLDADTSPLGGQNPVAHSWDTQNLARLDWSLENAGLFGDWIRATLYHRYERNQLDDPGRTEFEAPIELRTETARLAFLGRDRWQGEWLGAAHVLDLNIDTGRDFVRADDREDRGRNDVDVALQESAAFFDRRLTIVPGVRLNWTEGFGTEWLPSIGLVISPQSWLAVKANANRSYRVPTFNELFFPDKQYIRGNPDLEPESSTNADVGLELGPGAWRFFREARVSGGVFLQEIDDSIVWMQISPYTVMPVNTGPARVRGFELAGQLGVTPYLMLSGNYTQIDAESRNTGLPLVGRPDAEAYARAVIGPPDHFKLTGELEYTGEIYVSASGARKLEPRTVWNVSAAWNLASLEALHLGRFVTSLWIYAALDNITDVAVRDMQYLPQPGRAGYLGMEVEL